MRVGHRHELESDDQPSGSVLHPEVKGDRQDIEGVLIHDAQGMRSLTVIVGG